MLSCTRLQAQHPSSDDADTDQQQSGDEGLSDAEPALTNVSSAEAELSSQG